MEITRHDEVSRADVEMVIARIGGAGVYLSRDLYAAYAEYAREKGREPAPPNAWGRAVGKAGGQHKARTVNGVKMRAWLV